LLLVCSLFLLKANPISSVPLHNSPLVTQNHLSVATNAFLHNCSKCLVVLEIFYECVLPLLPRKSLFLWLGQEFVLCVLLVPFVCNLLQNVYLRFGCLLLWLFCWCRQVLAVNQIPFLKCRQLPEQ